MERLDAAVARFCAALDALDAYAASNAESASQGDLTDELAKLRLEREGFKARIAVLEKQSSSLAGLTETVETRLDDAIAEIRAALGRG